MGPLQLDSEMKSIEDGDGILDASFFNEAALECLISSEISAVLALMRKYARWGSRYMSGDDQFEHSLILSLKALRKQIFSWKHPWSTIDPLVYFQPFLDVIRSDEVGAPLISMALSSVHKIIALDVLALHTVNIEESMHVVVDAVTSCRFEVTDSASEEVVFLKILQVLLACIRSKASDVLSNRHACTIVSTCFRIVNQAGTKGELLQKIARHTTHEIVRCIFSHLPSVRTVEGSVLNVNRHLESIGATTASHSTDSVSVATANRHHRSGSSTAWEASSSSSSYSYAVNVMAESYGIPCMVEIFRNLCSLLNGSDSSGSGSVDSDEEFTLFILSIINSAVELGGRSIRHHPKLLNLIQDDLFRTAIQFGMSPSPPVLSSVCSVVLNLYQNLRAELKLQLEAFFSHVMLRLARSRYGATHQQQEAAMEALVDFCRQKSFMVEMYANFDCDITCSNVFEDITNLLCRSAFPTNGPLSSMHLLALDGLIAVVQGMAERIAGWRVESPENGPANPDAEYVPFWMLKCDDYTDPKRWVPFVRKRKNIKRRLMMGADHFNRDVKKGLEFLQGSNLLPVELHSQHVACFFRYTSGLNKDHVGEFLGNHDEFCVEVLREFAGTFDFRDMNLDTALRLFLETFRLPGESQKIQRVLEAFSEKYYEQSPRVLVDRDAALVLSYSIIMLNTDQHNAQVKKKMTEDDFVRNNRHINGGRDLPREFLSELYRSICGNEIRTTPERASPGMTPSRWIDLIHKSRRTDAYVVAGPKPHLDRDMFAVMSGPTIAAVSVVFDHAEHEDTYQTCIDGFLSVAKISACHRLDDVVDDLTASLCKFTTLLDPNPSDEPVLAFGDDLKARMATLTVFSIANRYGDCVRTGWRNVLGCILRLHKLGLLPARVAADDSSAAAVEQANPSLPFAHAPPVGTPRRSSGLIGRFSQLLSLDSDEPGSRPTEQQVAAHGRAIQTIQNCHIDSLFTESKFLNEDSLVQLVRAVVWASGRRCGAGPADDEDTAVFCLELLIVITLKNRERVSLMWNPVYEHVAGIVQSALVPSVLVEKAVSGLLRICHRLLPSKESLADELLRLLQLVPNSRIADAYCARITAEVGRLLTGVRSASGWHTVLCLLASSAQHPEASESGLEALTFVMSDSDGSRMNAANVALCIDAARQFAESRVGPSARSVLALDVMVSCVLRWADGVVARGGTADESWLRLVQAVRRVCSDHREDVRNHAVSSLRSCLSGSEGLGLSHGPWLQCFDAALFPMVDDLAEIAAQGHSHRNMEGTIVLSVRLVASAFVQSLPVFAQLAATFRKLWMGVLTRMENCTRVKVKGKKCERLASLVPDVLRTVLVAMKSKGLLVQRNAIDGDNLWDLTWIHVNNISPHLQSELFPPNPVPQPPSPPPEEKPS